MEHSLWKFLVRAAVIVSTAACTALPSAPPDNVVPLKNPSFNAGPDGKLAGWAAGEHLLGNSYTFAADPVNPRSGPTSGRIERYGTEPFGLLDEQIRMKPEWRNKTLRLSGWLRSQDVDGVGGALMLRADGGSGQIIQWNFMDDNRVTGTRDWKQYSIDLKIPPDTFFFQVGVMLQGGGKLWVDDLQLELVD
ncbi:hypothetical protein BH11PSE11_BH11PSE11_38010 [soil metagenome]